MSKVTIILDTAENESHVLVPEGAEPADIGAAFREMESLGWEELTVDETGDLPEILDDGTTKLIFVRARES